VIQMFQDLADAEDQKPWEEFCKLYHQFIKIGITRDLTNRARLAKLVRFHSTQSGDKQVGFEDYISKMKEGQSTIYYLGGDDLETMRKSPLLERANKKGIEVLLFTHPVDEYMVGALQKYDKYQLLDISKSGLKLEGDTPQEDLAKTYKPLTDYLTDILKGKVTRVEVTTRLTSTPCALVSPQWAPSANMERITRAQALQDGNAHQRFSKKVLELNPRHPIVKKLLTTVEASEQNDETADIATLLFDTASLHSGVPLEAPLGVANRLDKVIAHALKIDPSETAEEEEIAPLPPKSADSKDKEADGSPEGTEFKFDGLEDNGGSWSVQHKDDKDDL